MSHLVPVDNVKAVPPVDRSLQTATSIQRIRRRLQNAAIAQERLADSRERFLKERERVRATGVNVRKKRVEAGSAEAMFMSALREYLSQSNVEMPRSLADAYHTVETSRDELGVLEDDYQEADRNLAGTEWSLMDQENDFFQFDLLEQFDDAVSDLGGETNETADNLQLVPVRSDAARPTVNLSPSPSNDVPESESTPAPESLCPLSQVSEAMYATEDGPQQTKLLQLPRLMVLPPPPEGEGLLRSDSRIDQYRVVTAELEDLRKDFDSLRHAEADRLGSMDDEHAIKKDGQIYEAREVDHGAAAPPYFSVLQQISDHEVAAQRLKPENTLREVQLPIERRCSDPTHLTNNAPAPSLFMGRALTETALPLLCDDPKTKDRVREWLLIYLKENAVQKALYRSILAGKGVDSPIVETWEDRAIHFWDVDNASNYENTTRATSYVPEDEGTFSMIDGSFGQQSQLGEGTQDDRAIKLAIHEEDVTMRPELVSTPNPTSAQKQDSDTSEFYHGLDQKEYGMHPRNRIDDDSNDPLGIAPIILPDLQTLQDDAVNHATSSHLGHPDNLKTNVDTRSRLNQTETAEPNRTGQSPRPKEYRPQTPDHFGHDTPWSQIQVLGISSRPKSDDGGVNSRHERSSYVISRLSKLKRSQSVSYVAEV